MSKTKEWFMQQQELMVHDDSDLDYFTLMSEQEWQQAVADEEEKLRDKYGNGVYAKLRFQEFLNKNC